MKNTSLIISIAALVLAVVLAIFQFTSKNGKADKANENGSEAKTEQGAIVYFNMDRVLNEYDMANELRSAVESKVQSISQEVNRRASKLQKEANAFQEKIDKGLITRSVAEVQGQKLQQQQNEYQSYAAQKSQEMQEEQAVMMNQIGDAIKKFLDKYNAEKKYAMIIATQGDVLPAPVVVGDSTLDITDDILAGLNAEYVKSKGGKVEEKPATEQKK